MSTEKDELQETKYSDLFKDDKQQFDDDKEPKVKRTRRPRGSGTTTARVATITKDSIRSAIELANLGLAFTAPQYALVGKNDVGHPNEIDELTDVWFEVIKQYPSVGKYLVVGQKLGMWGNLIFVHYQIVMRRYNIVAANRNKTGTTRPASGNDRERKDNVSGTPTSVAS